MKLVTPQQALDLVTSGAAYGIDVREQHEWDAGHFDQFKLNPLSEFDLSAVPTDKPIIFICRSGNRSGQVCNALAQSGLEIMNLDGGMLAWQAAGLPMSATSGNPLIQ